MTKNTGKMKLKKQVSFHEGKKVYLLGESEDKIRYWLEEPRWDCGWYWGYGYVKTYTNNRHPERAKDIRSHEHISGFVGVQEEWDLEKHCLRKTNYIHNLYDNKKFAKTTFTAKEGWDLSELFKEFYLLQDMAEYCGKNPCGCHLTTSPVDQGKKSKWAKEINQVMIPIITAKISEILTP
jgi:hypothetical protein